MSTGRYLKAFSLTVALAAPWVMTACAGHHYYHDSYYNDDHHWDRNEIVFYKQWSVETHRDPHRDFRKLSPEEQRGYWEWRHHHGDHDHH